MTIRCSICKLPAEKLEALEAAILGGDISLHELANSTGLSKSAIHRHKQHLVPARPVTRQQAAEELPPDSPSAVTVRAIQPPPSQPIAPESRAAEVEVIPAGADRPKGPVTATKARLLARIESLWGECTDGLRAAKEPVVLTKADGSTVEVPGGDLRARAGFIREARNVLELQGAATGDLVKGDPAIVGPVMIVVPAIDWKAAEAAVVKIGRRQ
jgi:hypothetical protein